MTANDDVYLVTGALGCIGAWTVRELIRQGARVIAFDRSTDTARLRMLMEPTELQGVRIVDGDITNLDQLGRVLNEDRVSHVIHLAALQVPFCHADPPLGALVNVVGTATVFEAVKRRLGRIRGLVYMSSIGMYDAADAGPDTGVIAEDTIAHPQTHYGVYKQANEGTARVYWQDDGVPSVGLRPFVVYGVGRDQGLTSSPTKAMAAAATGRPCALTYSGRSVFQYAGDVAAIAVRACRAGIQGAPVFNLPGESVGIADIVATIEDVVPGSTRHFTVVDRPIPFPEDVASDAIRRALGPLPQTPLRDGIRATIDRFAALARDGRLPESSYRP